MRFTREIKPDTCYANIILGQGNLILFNKSNSWCAWLAGERRWRADNEGPALENGNTDRESYVPLNIVMANGVQTKYAPDYFEYPPSVCVLSESSDFLFVAMQTDVGIFNCNTMQKVGSVKIPSESFICDIDMFEDPQF